MTIDFSLFKNIDFTKTENILFFFIILVITLIIFFIIVIIVSKIVKGIKRIIVGDNVRRPKFDRVINSNGLSSLNIEGPIRGDGAPRPIVNKANLKNNFGTNDKSEKEKKDIVSIEKEKAGKKVEEGLSALKTDIPGGGLQAKMPSRVEESPEDIGQQEIKIPRAERSAEQVNQAYKQEGVKNEINREIPHSSKEISGSGGGNNVDSSALFQGRHDIPRMKLEHEMRTNPKIWKAARETMLNLTPIERAKLVKETFSSAYGRNISKTDLKQTVKKLDRKMRSSKTPKEHEKLRKEIKFFKKIGGI